MFPALLLTLLLVLPITGSPVKPGNSPTSVPITSRLNFSNGTYNLEAHDIHRVDVPLTHKFYTYTITVGIGSPPTSYKLILASGSANTWVGAGTAYQATGTSVRTPDAVSVNYGAGHLMNGMMYLDTVTVGPGLTVVLPIGVADVVVGFAGFDGVLGIGPAALTFNTLPQMPTKMIPTVTDCLVGQNIIRAGILGVFFRPYVGSQGETAGQLTFGGTDNTLHIHEITYTYPIPNIVAAHYWGIHQSITYGTTVTSPILQPTIGIVDSSSTFIYILTEAFQRYQAVTGGQQDPATGLLVITGNQYNALENLNFNIGGQIFTLTPNAQIWPRALNHILGAQRDFIYLVIRDMGMGYHRGPFDFIIGNVFMQRFYTVFDASNSRVGFSATEFTAATTN